MQGYANLKGYGEFDARNRPSGWNKWLAFSICPWRFPPPDRPLSVGPPNGGASPHQSPAPRFGEKNWNLSGFPSHSLESGGGGFFYGNV